ncbi:MAG TPA: hypothetical protein VII98_14115 [Solirubrobacteraceae bacterium]
MRAFKLSSAVVVAATAVSVGCATPALAVSSAQRFSFSASPAASSTPAAANANIGSGTGSFVALGLTETVTVQVFNAPAGPALLVTGQTPLSIRTVVPGTLTTVVNRQDRAFHSRRRAARPAPIPAGQ